ncbi:MAG: patatin-like phospholipase family protein [Vicinamibacterales bacterium]
MIELLRGDARRSWIVALLLAAGLAAPASAQAPASAPQKAQPQRPRIGLALGGGGARGFAHIGVLQWLDEHRIPVDVVGGTSMGGLVGAGFATGMAPHEIRNLIDEVDWASVLAPDTPFPYKTFRRKEDTRAFPSALRFGLRGGFRMPSGLSAAEEADLLFDRMAAPYGSHADFNALPTPFRCVATDLRNAETVVFDSGWLGRALRATVAIPGVFAPVSFDGKVLVDGGVLNNVPADVIRQTGLADFVIAVDMGVEPTTQKKYDSIFGVLDETLNVMMRSGTRRALASADVVLAPAFESIGGADFSRVNDLVEYGYAEADAHAAELLPYAISPEAYAAWESARQARRPTGQIVPTSVTVEGLAAGDAARIASRLKPYVGRPLDADALDRDLLLLTGSGRYESATYRIDDAGGETDLAVALKAPAHGPPFLALALDLQNTQSSSVSATVRGRMLLFDVAGHNSEGRVDVSLGDTLAASAGVYRPVGWPGFFVEPRAFAERRDTPVFEEDGYTAEYREYHAGGSFDAGFTTAYRLETRVGYTYDHLRMNVRIGDSDLPSVNGPQQYVSAQVKFDGQTGPTIPERGLYVKADLRQFFQVPDVVTPDHGGAADPDKMTSGRMQFSLFTPVGRRGRVTVGGSGGTSFGDTTVVNAFALGGPFQLGAYYPGELRGSNAVVANVGYFHELARFAEGTIGRLWFGSLVEEGSAFERWSAAKFYTNFTAGFVLESPIGPLFAGTSVGLDGRYRVYFSLGPIIK